MLTNTHFFDRYSVIHAAWGVAFEASRVPAPFAIGSHVVFEASENTLKRLSKRSWPDARPDAIQNQVGDLISFSLGYFGARLLGKSLPSQALLTGFAAAGAAIWMVNIFAQPERT